MTSSKFKEYRQRYSNNQAPHLVTDLRSLQVLGENHFSVNGTDFCATENVSRRLDKVIGMGDSKLVRNASGELGLKNVRNYFSTAKSADKNQKIVLIADPKDKIVVDLKPLKEDYISVDGFFDFLEFFTNEYDFEIDNMHISDSIVGGGTAYLKPNKPTFSKVSKGEEFMDNGLFVNWDVGELETGNYFMRLVCANGAVEQVNSEQAKIHSFGENNIQKLITTMNDKGLMQKGFDNYVRKLKEKTEITASMKELHHAVNFLNRAEVDKDIIEEIVPYNALRSEYENRRIDISKRDYMAKSNMSLWKLYNNLTQFATHNPSWQKDDIRRSQLIERSNYFLNKKPDIKPYLEVI